MSRSSKKGPYVDQKLVKKVIMAGESRKPIKTWARSSDISPEMIGNTLEIHNGRSFIPVLINENMVGHKVGEFAPTRRFIGHSQKK